MTIHELPPRRESQESLRDAGAAWVVAARGTARANPAPVTTAALDEPVSAATQAPGPAAPSGMDDALLKLLKGDDDTKRNASRRLSVDRITRALLLRWKSIALAVAACATAGLMIGLFVIPKKWEGNVTMIVTDRKAILSVGGGQPYQTRDYTVDTLIDTLKLPRSLDEAMRRSGVVAKRTVVASAIKVSTSSKSDVLNLHIAWGSPREAAALANNLADVFIESTTRIRADEAAKDFSNYDRQLGEARSRLEAAENSLIAFQQNKRIANIEEEIKTRQMDLSRTEADHWASTGAIDGLKAARSDMDSVLKAAPDTVTTTVFRNPVGKRLEDVELQLKEARTRYTEENPKVISLREQADALRGLVAKGDNSGGEVTKSPNDLRRDLKVKLADVATQLRLAEGREAGLANSVQHQQAQLKELTEVGKEYRELEARAQAARDVEKSLSAKVEESRVAKDGGEPSLQIVERAAVPTTSEPSKRRLAVIGSILVGLLIGALVALAREVLDPRIRCVEDVEDFVEDGGVCAEVGHVPPGEAENMSLTSPPFRSFRRFVNDLHASSGDWAVLAIVSAGSGEGRSTVARDMALCLAARGERTTLIDGDLRPASTCRSVAATGPGLSDLLLLGGPVNSYLQRGPHERLSVVAAGERGMDDLAPLLLGHPEADQALRQLRGNGRRIIIDLPPAGDCEGGFELACKAGSVILAARYGISDRPHLKALAARFAARGVHIVGAVVLDVPPERQHPYAGPSAGAALKAEWRRLVERLRRRTADA
jgi:uncharacterized protein involved in exopolysaccharide biosynthesis